MKLIGVEVPKFIYGLPVDGKLTAVLLVGAVLVNTADPKSCAGPGETWELGANPVTMSTFELSKVHARLGWGSAADDVKDILF